MGASAEQFHPYSTGERVDYTWSAHLTLEQPQDFEGIVRRTLGGAVLDRAHPNWPLSGAVIGSGEASDRSAVVLALDPSKQFGTPTKEQCEAIVAEIITTHGWQRQPETPSELRVILGRRIGYDGEEYSMEAVREILANYGGHQLSLTEADLFSLRYVDELREYHEPGVIIEGATQKLGSIARAAAFMGQERFVAEITDKETQVYSKDR